MGKWSFEIAQPKGVDDLLPDGIERLAWKVIIPIMIPDHVMNVDLDMDPPAVIVSRIVVQRNISGELNPRLASFFKIPAGFGIVLQNGPGDGLEGGREFRFGPVGPWANAVRVGGTFLKPQRRMKWIQYIAHEKHIDLIDWKIFAVCPPGGIECQFL